MSNITNQEDFFAFILINTPIKIFSIVTSSICIVLVLLLCYGIIWYNINSSDRNHTLLNRLASSLCFVLAEMFITIQFTELHRTSLFEEVLKRFHPNG